jgi:hypothetical protein
MSFIWKFQYTHVISGIMPFMEERKEGRKGEKKENEVYRYK